MEQKGIMRVPAAGGGAFLKHKYVQLVLYLRFRGPGHGPRDAPVSPVRPHLGCQIRDEAPAPEAAQGSGRITSIRRQQDTGSGPRAPSCKLLHGVNASARNHHRTHKPRPLPPVQSGLKSGLKWVLSTPVELSIILPSPGLAHHLKP